ncbi:MAG: Type IV pilus assembly protein PilM [Parcubacteria group bacterium GW2011_GWA2_47_64]|nr:MAG: Type IV pilus assembly protein PilM [Parcubacteria group bacterium GW2011_GWA2_47_64]KKU96896.1 MAG: Type IV pilus assembly protein PilM [Parcubacteria group bacterium GW2011_GWC2_48_17]
MFDRLKNLLTNLQSQNDSVVGVDIGNAYIKIVQLRRKSGKAVLETYGSLALGPYAGVEIGRATHLPPDKIAEALRDILREAHATSKRAAFAIPFSSSLVTSMDMRVFDQRQLATVVSLEARKYIPVPISEVNLDWWVIPEEPTVQENVGGQTPPNSSDQVSPSADSGGKGADTPINMKILIAAIHNEALNRYRDIVKDSGLESSFLEVELFSTIRALFPQDLEPHAVLDLGAGETKLYIIDRGLIRTSHIISHGGQDITLSLSRALGISVEEAEKMKRREGLQNEGREETASLTAILNVIFSETSRTLLSFEHKFGRKVKNIILSGGGANLGGISTLAQKNFSIPVERADPFKQVEAPAFLEEVLKNAGPEFTVALGIAFRELQESG